MISQLVLNIFFSASIYLLIALSFSLIYSSLKFFYFAHAATISLSSYLLYSLLEANFSITCAIIISLLVINIIIIIIDFFIYSKFRKKDSTPLVQLITSIGLYVIIQNLISLLWGDETRTIHSGAIKAGHTYLGAYVTNIQIISILVSISLFFSLYYFLKKTRLGLKIRAIASNNKLLNIYGIDPSKIILLSFCIGSTLAGIVGFLVAFDINLTPTMGFRLLLYGVVVMIIGGVGSTKGLIWGSLLLSISQHVGAYYIDSKWMDVIAYIILILFLIWKPLGFSGRRLKKIEL